ncbi:Transcription accessory protein TEX, contains S1 domain [Plasmopara halstedii]|uniref:Endonuclease/exonuclease/phosphatase family domain-containing protein 1 n=1 Tax=Plasmopara halstedii TaxID=4781 RepID=A0A0P1B020_PLAHL|nr:Transcription accessory protein TEX, contains S1 domain [Plasmopara halstedii]CEG48036.1 Transcription accessory protein TEX, contains S1 domain [Plasmopara halstedii]|eukprot:XP_024584405.1 Transcription accessory protein TEX, contains S1 domain [Plasmopara halstedii]
MNLNTATLTDLQQLPGVGYITAQRIVESRPFFSITDLLRVKGIGSAKFAAITAKYQIYVDEKSLDVDTNVKCNLALSEIDLNTASERQLQQLSGVGPALAQRIINARPLYRKEDLLAVNGINTKSYMKIQVMAYVEKTSGNAKSGNVKDVDVDKVDTDRNFHDSKEIERDVRGSLAFMSNSYGDDNRPFLVASWNIRNISRRKNVYLLERIAKVLDEFDLVALQEVRDLLVLKRLKTMMPGWDYEVSEAVGSMMSDAKKRLERYAFFYRRCAVELVEKCSLIEDSSKMLIRSPCVASFQSTKMLGSSKLIFTLMNVHVSFGNKQKRLAEIVEINRLVDEMSTSAPKKRIVVLGDFNLSQQDLLNSSSLYRLALIRSPLSTTVYNKLYDNILIDRSDFRNCKEGEYDFIVDSGVLRIDWRYYPLSKSCLSAAHTLSNSAMPPRLQTYMSRVQCCYELSDHCPVWVAFTVVSKQKNRVIGEATCKSSSECIGT